MKLLLDQGLPRTAAELLRGAGFDTLHVGDIGYATASDAAILHGGAVSPSPAECLPRIEVLDACYRLAVEGREVVLEGE